MRVSALLPCVNEINNEFCLPGEHVLTQNFSSSTAILPNGEKGEIFEFPNELPENGDRTSQSVPPYAEEENVKKTMGSPGNGPAINREMKRHQREQSPYRREGTTSELFETRGEQGHCRAERRQGIEPEWVSDRDWDQTLLSFRLTLG